MSETFAQEVEANVKAMEAEAVKVVEAIVPEVKKMIQELTAEEKLVIREIENEYLKAQMEIQRLSQTTQGAQKKFTDFVESLVKKYVVNPTEWTFDNLKLVFTRK
jgi:type IV secretory pathway VirB4 component